MRKKLTTLSLLMSIALTALSQTLAFPGAQGWGRYAWGGRSGSVYHVTNLNDSGSGSLRDAVSSPGRIVVFDVAGVIQLKSRLVFSRNLYVAGQTAPGEGITVYGNGVSFSGASNIICRYMRFRMGAGGDSGKDCAGVANGTNMIFDHCSFSWGRDETFSINPDGKGDLHSITLQNCIIGQGLMSHSAGGLIQADSISLYRNLYCDNSTRNNKVKGRNQYVNNIVYNWSNGAYLMGGESSGHSYCNIVGNLFINGPSGGGNAFTEGNSNFHCYTTDNWQDKNRDGQFNPALITSYSAADRVSTPYQYPTLTTIPAQTLLDELLPDVGASLPYRDYADYYMIDEVRSLGKQGALISNEGSLPFGTPTSWNVWKGTGRTDTDGDGMPDAWENANGLNPNKDDAMHIASNGYANIENYINSIDATYSEPYLRAPLCVEMLSATTTTMNIAWRDYTQGEEGFTVNIVNSADQSSKTLTIAENHNSVLITGLQPGTAYIVQVIAFKGETTSTPSVATTFKTKPEEAGIIDIDTFTPDATWETASTWDTESTGWLSQTGHYTDGDRVLFANSEAATITIATDIQPQTIVVNSQADLIISGSGSITGNASLNKAGDGTLTMRTTNSYTGATVLHGGTLSFSSLRNGGTKSGIGASDEFAQNWIFDGGTYKYTGVSTSTNRSARLLSPTEFYINLSTATVTMNGTFEGATDFILGGKGMLSIGTTHFFAYTGATILAGGTLALPSTDITAAGIGASSKLVFAGGTLQTKGETENYENYTFPIEVREGTTSQFSPNRNCYIKSTVSGSGTLQLNIPYVREYIQGNWDGFTGRLIANSVNGGGLFLLNSDKSIANGVVELKGGARACGWDTNGNYTLGGLAGDAGTYLSGSSKQTNGFKCTWTIGTANTNETFRGSINNWSCSGSGHTGTTSIIKAGSGDWRLTGSNDYSGTTTINGGRLVVNGTNSGSGAITVNADGTLAGTGTVAGTVTVKKGGIIFAGDTTLTGRNTLTLKSRLTVSSGGIVSVPIYYDSTTIKTNRLELTAGATFSGAILNLEFQDLMSTLDIAADTEFKVFSITGSATGRFTQILPESPGEGKEWDTSQLLQSGVIRVVSSSTGIEPESITIDRKSSDSQSTYDLSGRQLPASATASQGIFIVGGSKIRVNN